MKAAMEQDWVLELEICARDSFFMFAGCRAYAFMGTVVASGE